MNRYEEVLRVLDTLYPAMAADGGGAELVEVQGGDVVLRLTGACCVCPSAELTLRRGIEPALKQALPWVESVIRAPVTGASSC